MNLNMGALDRGIRIIAALAVGVLYFMGQISGMAAIVLGALAGVFVLTSLVGTCPLYLPFKLSTKAKEPVA